MFGHVSLGPRACMTSTGDPSPLHRIRGVPSCVVSKRVPSTLPRVPFSAPCQLAADRRCQARVLREG
eukprot:11373909-Prorocentrum_lima.AAC.1